MARAEVLDDRRLHRELDEVEREEPDDVLWCKYRTLASVRSTRNTNATHPNPDDTNPRARDGLDLGEAPVAVRGDDRRDELSNAERTHQGDRRTLHKEEPVRTRGEDEGLRDDGHLEVDGHVQLAVVVIRRLVRAAGDCRAELVVEPRRPDDDCDERDDRDRTRRRTRKSRRDPMSRGGSRAGHGRPRASRWYRH